MITKLVMGRDGNDHQSSDGSKNVNLNIHIFEKMQESINLVTF